MFERLLIPRPTVYRRLAAFVAMLAVAMVYRVDHLTDWDSWDYAAQAIQGHSSDLLLGRWWFLAVMRGAYLAGRGLWGLDALSGHLAMQVCSALLMATALVVLMAWTRRLTRSVAGEYVVAAVLLPGPFVGIYASAVMTESLTVLMLGLAFWLWEVAIGNGHDLNHKEHQDHEGETAKRMAMAFLAGCAFGVAADIREPAVLFGAWPILSVLTDRPRRGGRLLATAVGGSLLTLGIGVLGAWAWYPWVEKSYFANLFHWTRAMAQEREMFVFHFSDNLGWLVYYCKMTSAVATYLLVPAFMWAVMRGWIWRQQATGNGQQVGEGTAMPSDQALVEGVAGRHSETTANPLPVACCLLPPRRFAWLFLACIPYAGSLLFNHDLCINPRFVLPLLWVTAPVIAGMFVDLALWAGRGFRLRLAGVAIALMAGGGWALASTWPEIDRVYFAYCESMENVYRSLMRESLVHDETGQPVVVRDVPDGAVVIAGPATPVVFYINRLQVRSFKSIDSGWGWPGKEKLGPLIRQYQAQGRPVYVNVDEGLWHAGTRKYGEWEMLVEAIEDCDVQVRKGSVMGRVVPLTAATRSPLNPAR